MPLWRTVCDRIRTPCAAEELERSMNSCVDVMDSSFGTLRTTFNHFWLLTQPQAAVHGSLERLQSS